MSAYLEGGVAHLGFWPITSDVEIVIVYIGSTDHRSVEVVCRLHGVGVNCADVCPPAGHC